MIHLDPLALFVIFFSHYVLAEPLVGVFFDAFPGPRRQLDKLDQESSHLSQRRLCWCQGWWRLWEKIPDHIKKEENDSVAKKKIKSWVKFA
jgi:hypothetical protein